MKIITDSNKTRQVQPIDFAFLSMADKEVVQAVETMLRTMYDWAEDYPIIVSGLEYNVFRKPPQPASYKITSGKVLWNGLVYDVAELQLKTGLNTIGNIIDNVYFKMKRKVVEPSPVYDKNMAKSINCHYEHYGELQQVFQPLTLGGTTQVSGGTIGLNVKYTDMYRVKSIAGIVGELMNDLEQRVIKLEKIKLPILTQ